MLTYWIKTVEHMFPAPDGIRRIVKFDSPLEKKDGVVAYLDIYGEFASRSARGVDYKDAAANLAKKLKGELVEQIIQPPQGENRYGRSFSNKRVLAPRRHLNGQGPVKSGSEEGNTDSN